jgi:IS605 OrfB family transposase
VNATLKLQLHIDDTERDALLETLTQSTACFNAVCLEGWKTGERNSIRLHHATYYGLRSTYPDLPAQLHCAARVKAAESLKSADAIFKTGRKANCPQSINCTIRYDARSYWVRLSNGTASLATTAGRIIVQFNLCGYYRRYLDWKPCSADLCYDRKTGRFYLHVVVKQTAPDAVCDGVLGVDLGIVEIATDSHGRSYSGEAVKAVRTRVRRIRRILQSKGTRSAKKHLRRIRQKQSRYVRDVNHCVSKSLVQTATQSRKALALEDLKNIRDRADTVSRQMRWLLGNWAFDQLRNFVAYKAEASSVPVVYVDPRNSSRICSRCGHCDKANRKSQASFVCLKCGFQANADFNAAVNLEARGYRSEALMCQLRHCQGAEVTGLDASCLLSGTVSDRTPYGCERHRFRSVRWQQFDRLCSRNLRKKMGVDGNQRRICPPGGYSF